MSHIHTEYTHQPQQNTQHKWNTPGFYLFKQTNLSLISAYELYELSHPGLSLPNSQGFTWRLKQADDGSLDTHRGRFLQVIRDFWPFPILFILCFTTLSYFTINEWTTLTQLYNPIPLGNLGKWQAVTLSSDFNMALRKCVGGETATVGLECTAWPSFIVFPMIGFVPSTWGSGVFRNNEY